LDGAAGGVADRAAARHFEERVDPVSGERYLAVYRRGAALLDDAILYKGTCFTPAERDALGLRGIVPPAVATPEEQAARAYGNYGRAGDEIQRYLFLRALQDRNETLFYRLLLDHLDEMAPIVYTPTVGRACERFSHIYRRPRGLYVTPHDRGRIAEALRNGEYDTMQVIVVTDNEAILGIGDQGVGGMGIPIGKLALYTAGAGIHPARGLPLDLDVGTDNAALLADPLYLGVRQPRLRGEAYDSLVDELVTAIAEVFPGAIVQWEDFSNENAFRILDRYRRRLPSFNDDIQGTGAVVVAGIRAALRLAGRRIEDERVVLFGAGASGAGSARAVRDAMRAAGVPEAELSRRVLCLDSRGLILPDRQGLAPHKRSLAADPSVVAGWAAAPDGRFGLPEVVRHFQPGVLIGASGQGGAFTEAIVRSMLEGCARPIVFPLSNPTNRAEVTPEDALRWTNGAAILSAGSPFPPVELGGKTVRIGQGNNALIFPGVGLAAVAVGAHWIPDQAFSAASAALAGYTAPSLGEGLPIFPPLSRLRDVSRAVAIEVARALVEAGAAAPLAPREIEARIAATMWEPVYRPYRPA
jgi:malic enzyme